MSSVAGLVADYLASVCAWCGETFKPKRAGQLYCHRQCNEAHKYTTKKAKREVVSVALLVARNTRYRDRYICKLDPRETGPLNQSDTSVAKLKKDKATQQPLSKDIPTPTTVAVDNSNRNPLVDRQWAERQKRFRHADLPRLKTNFCPQCKAYVNQNHEHIEA